ncbi:MAG: Uma2 family endonuclease [Gemmatimonadaceae bacterium]|nr:Uma2 family endonuclease [Gemmatimonadaceae bacterium]
MSMPATTARLWTVAEVHALQDQDPHHRYEVVDGELLVTPAPRRSHQRAVLQLARALSDQVERFGFGEVLMSPSDVRAEGQTSVQPDVFVIPLVNGRPAADEMVVSPVLVIEVLSPSTARFDRLTKRRLYQRMQIEYWIVDLDSELIERWAPESERPEICADRVVWQPVGSPEALELDVAAFMRRALGVGTG